MYSLRDFVGLQHDLEGKWLLVPGMRLPTPTSPGLKVFVSDEPKIWSDNSPGVPVIPNKYSILPSPPEPTRKGCRLTNILPSVVPAGKQKITA